MEDQLVLTIDIGNHKTALAAMDADLDLCYVEYYDTQAMLRVTAKERHDVISDFLTKRRLPRIVGSSLASVVPALTPLILETLEKNSVETVQISGQSSLGIGIQYDNPASLGPDRIANALAVKALNYGQSCVVDIGTATNFDVVSSGGDFLGGAIAPGPNTSANALWAATARLQPPGWFSPKKALGQSTREALLSGCVLGYAGLIDGMVDRLEAEAGDFETVVFTGGLASVISPHCRRVGVLRPYLTLEGLRVAWDISRF